MTETDPNLPTDDTLPEPVVETRRSVSLVWLIPLVAAIIGGWLAFKAISEQGPTITITFDSAEGLEAGQTKIKYKNVEVGQVETIQLSEDLSDVIVTAKLVKGSELYLTDRTRFWVVRARVAAGEVSGLETLFSGAYIALDPVPEGEPSRKFRALKKPPIVTTGDPGRQFVLRAPTLQSLDVGSPVYYRQIRVGQVIGYDLDEEGQEVNIKIFVDAPHYHRVRKNTRFWDAGGLDVSVTTAGVEIDTESFVSLMIGGVAFDTPTSLEASEPAEEGHIFRLYPNQQATKERTYTKKEYYILYFDSSVRGLTPGAPVELRGMKVGEVVDLRLEFHSKDDEFRVPVLIEIEPDRIDVVGNRPVGGGKTLEKLVEKGLRAQLKTGNLLTGQLLVDLVFMPEAPRAKVVYSGRYAQLPTVPTPLEEITGKLASMLDRLERLPIEEIAENLRDAVKGTSQLVNSPQLSETARRLKEVVRESQVVMQTMNRDVTPALSETLAQVRSTLATVEQELERTSPFQQQLNQLLQELTTASRSIRLLADYLERHPEALLRGKQ
jgi:paraquat-inducible protein B